MDGHRQGRGKVQVSCPGPRNWFGQVQPEPCQGDEAGKFQITEDFRCLPRDLNLYSPDRRGPGGSEQRSDSYSCLGR